MMSCQMFAASSSRGTPLAGTQIPEKGRNDEYYTFIPAEWPFDHLYFVKVGNSGRSISERFNVEEHLLHVDLLEFSETLTRCVIELHDAGFEVLESAYRTFTSNAFDPVLVQKLEEAREKPGFHRFERV